MLKLPEKIYIAKTDKEKYEKLEKEGFFEDRNHKDQFLLAMGFGVKNKVHRSFKERHEFFWRKDLGIEGETLISAVGIYFAYDVDILTDMQKVYGIAEEYAHAGIDLLYNKMESQQVGSFWKQFEKDIHEIYHSLNLPK
jgi:hypothetical protein